MMSVLIALMSDHVPNPEVTTEAVCTSMKRHGYEYKKTGTTDAHRVEVKADDFNTFYTRTLPQALNNTHSSLVFNMDEMGSEMFADRKNMYVFVRRSRTGQNRRPTVGVPRSTRRCKLIGCISFDGTRLCPAIITKTETISSAVFAEGGYTSDRLKIFTTENSFINNDVFGEWVCDVFLPQIERRRRWLRERLGAFDERAVLILDRLKVHMMEPFVEFLRRRNVTVLVLVPHTPT